MTPRKKLQCGVGAVVWVYLRYLHPSKTVKDFYINSTKDSKVTDLLVVGQGVRKVHGKDQMCVLLRHDSFPNVILYCVKRWGKHVVAEGDPQHFFDFNAGVVTEEEGATEEENGEDVGTQIPEHVFHLAADTEDIQHIRGLGFEVDDDNDPAPENVPDPNEENQGSDEQTWGWNGVCERDSKNFFNVQPSLNHRLVELPAQPCDRTIVHLFMILFPMKYVEDVILKSTNDNLPPEQNEITLGELLRFIGIWFFLATTAGFPRREFFSTYPVNPKHGAPYRVTQWMSRKRFEAILKALSFTNKAPPTYKDRFWLVRDMIASWNDNMENVFKCGWVTCLDESMSSWLSRWTCPGWMFVPRKPRPFGNEYHTICCGISGVMFAVQLCEGKDRPKELPSPPQNEKTSRLLVEMCRSIYGSGKVVVLDSGFCVMKGLIALKKLGVYAHAVVKKRRFWPKHVPGEAIDERMANQPVGSTDALRGVLDGEPYNIFVMKEPDYSMKLMATYGGLTTLPNEPDVER